MLLAFNMTIASLCIAPMVERSDPPRRCFSTSDILTHFQTLLTHWIFQNSRIPHGYLHLLVLFYLQLHITEIPFPLRFIRSISHAPKRKQIDGADAQQWIADDPNRTLTSGIGITW